MTSRSVTVLVVDDLPAIREGLCFRLGLEPDLVITGAAANGDEALTLARTLRPDIVLLDVAMPGRDGISVARMLRETLPDCVIVILTLYDDAGTRQRAREAGATAVVGKHDPVEVLLATVRVAAAGRPR